MKETAIREYFYPTIADLITIAVTGQNAVAEDAGKMLLLPNEAAIQWQPGPANLPKGSQIAVLAGDPGKPGPFVLRVKFPANTLVAPHSHATAENLTVLTGDFYHAMGETVDKTRGDQMKGSLTQWCVKRQGLIRKGADIRRFQGFCSPNLSLRFRDGFRGWNANRIPELLI